MSVEENSIVALIGPSGCGKSTFLRCLNRMNDLIDGVRDRRARRRSTATTSTTADVDVVDLRRRVGMVFQKSNPFPKSIYENVAYGPRIHGIKATRRSWTRSWRRACGSAALWDEVKDRLDDSAPGPFRRPAAAPVHRPRPGGRARSAADGRARVAPWTPSPRRRSRSSCTS